MSPVYFKNTDADKLKKNPSNKGQFPTYILNNVIYKGDNYYITLPIIDKIILFSDPLLSSEEKKQLNDILFFDAKNKEEGKSPESIVEVMQFKNAAQKHKTRYKNHYRITPPNSHGSVAFFLDPIGKKQRFIKMEFSPWKLGAEGVTYFIDWYDQHIVHSTYAGDMSKKQCIGKLHVAFDIVGIHIADLILNHASLGKASQWHGSTGRIETQYPNAKPGVSSKLKIYNKLKQATETGEYLPYGDDIPIVRVEKEITTKLSLMDLVKLKKNHFKGISLPLPLDIEGGVPEETHHWELFLDSVRYRGIEGALNKLPRSIRQDYIEQFDQCMVEVFPEKEICATLWSKFWPIALKKSGLLP